jgi:cystathionine gamma-lyase
MPGMSEHKSGSPQPERRSPRDATRVVRAGLPAPKQGDSFLPGPVFAAPFHAAGDPASAPYTYGRFHNPTWTAYESALAELEGGETVVFASGMAATAAVFDAVLRRGDVLVLPSDGYYTSRLLAQEDLVPSGVEVRTAPTAGEAQARCLEGARLLWIESPSNPGLDVCDIAALAILAHAQGALVAVDNTTGTVLCQQPLRLGADFSVASDTKALTGHGDLILGHVSARDAEWKQRLVTRRTRAGAVPGPMEVWLAHRSLATLDVRLERMCANAQAIAEFLIGRPEVREVRYPGLPGHTGHETAARQMSRFGPVVSFDLGSRAAAERFLAAATLVSEATSFGGVHTTAERRARWGADEVPEGFIRLSAGLEHRHDLITDLARALDALEEP